MKINLLVCLVTTLLFTGCNSNTSEPTNAKELTYLKVGNTWVYSFTHFNPDGSIKITWIDSTEVIGTSILGGKEYFKFTQGGHNRIDEQGLWYWIGADSGGRLGIKYPADVGEIWGRDTVILDYGTSHEDKVYLTASLANTDVAITTEAGVFSCLLTVANDTLASDGKPYNIDSMFVDSKYGVIKALGYEKRDPLTNELYKSSEMRLIRHNLP